MTQTQMEQNEKLIAAGALLPAKASLKEEQHVDLVSARCYGHRALGERKVVRLVPEALSRGEDITLDLLGFDKPTVTPKLAKQRRRSLGFPGWPLVNDPENARYALDVMKDFRKEAKRARSKPGHAKDGFEKIAKQLSRSVPHFLPSFYEEAGRAYLEESNTHYASQCFGKARDAEKVHALKVDEAYRMASFLEFALAGAVTIKALSQYAKDLATAYDAKVAYERFRELAVRRTLGGLPPWATMAKDLKQLAKTAGLDAIDEGKKILRELLPAASVARAPKQFWQAFESGLKVLVSEDKEVLYRLLQIAPNPSGDSAVVIDWLAMLDRLGALQEYDKVDDRDPKAPPAGAFFSRMIDASRRSWRMRAVPDEVFDLLRRMTDRLKAEGVPVRMTSNRYDELELDLCDLALEIGIPVADPKEDDRIDISDWVGAAGGDDDDDEEDQKKSKEHPRDPVFVAADPRWTKLLADSCQYRFGEDDFERVARGKKAFIELRRKWLDKLVSPEAGGLPVISTALTKIDNATSIATFTEFPEALPKLQGLTVVDRLGITLRGGIIGEWGWPELEAVCAEMDPKSEAKLKLMGAFPYAVVCDERRAVVVGPKGRLFEHDLQLPKKAEVNYLQYVDGQLLVVFRTNDYKTKAYWSDAPKKAVEVDFSYWRSEGLSGRQLPLKDGGVYLGGAGGVLRPGDTKIPHGNKDVLHDGETFWMYDYDRDDDKGPPLVEIDPYTGKKGRHSLPKFIEEFAEPGMTIKFGACELFPAPDGLEDSPLGLADGMIGWRARTAEVVDDKKGDRPDEYERIDGKRYVGTMRGGSVDEDDDNNGEERTPDKLLSRNDGALLPVDERGYEDLDDLEYTYALWNPEGTQIVSMAVNDGKKTLEQGAPQVLPLHWWHLLRLRDAEGSAALRSLSDADVEKLFATALQEVREKEDEPGDNKPTGRRRRKKLRKKRAARKAAAEETPTFDQTRAAVAEVLPAAGDERLQTAIQRTVLEAARLQIKHERLVALRDPENPVAQATAPQEDDQLAGKLRGVLDRIISTGWDSNLFGQLRAVGSYFETGEPPVEIPECGTEWSDLIGSIGALAFFATTPISSEEREAVLKLIEIWADTPMIDATKFRKVSIKVKPVKLELYQYDDDYYSAWGVCEHAGNRYFITGIDTDDEEDEQSLEVLEYAPSGKFALLPGTKLEGKGEAVKSAGWGDSADKLRTFVAVVRERGEQAFDAEAARALAGRTGLSYGEAALLVAGLPKIDAWEKNFLPKELREQMGLKVAEADVARGTFRSLENDKKKKILDAAMPDDAAALYSPLGEGAEDNDSYVARLAASWKAVMGKSVAIEPELAAQLNKDLSYIGRLQDWLPMLTNPAKVPELNKDAGWTLGEWGSIDQVGRESKAFDEDTLQTVSALIPYLHLELPTGHELLAKLPDVYKRAAKRIRNPKLLLDGPQLQTSSKKRANAFVAALGGKPYCPKGARDRKKEDYGCDAGMIMALPDPYEYNVSMGFRPALIEDWNWLHKLGDWYQPLNRCAELLLTDRLERIAERCAKSPLPDGSYEANPMLSVPELVTEIAEAKGIAEETAAYYLQLLTLPAPTNKKVQQYNGWKASQITRAVKELKAKKLVVEATRSRAGRKVFLPGGWEDLKSPNLPIETWKLPLYGVLRDDKSGKLSIPVRRIVPMWPLHIVFAQAWQRVLDGDEPRYEKVTRRR